MPYTQTEQVAALRTFFATEYANDGVDGTYAYFVGRDVATSDGGHVRPGPRLKIRRDTPPSTDVIASAFVNARNGVDRLFEAVDEALRNAPTHANIIALWNDIPIPEGVDAPTQAQWTTFVMKWKALVRATKQALGVPAATTTAAAVRLPATPSLPTSVPSAATSPWIYVGAAICAFGVGYFFWARGHR